MVLCKDCKNRDKGTKICSVIGKHVPRKSSCEKGESK